MAHAAQFTAAEPAFIMPKPVRAVKKALDAGPDRPVLLRRAGAYVRAIGWSDRFYLYVVRAARQTHTQGTDRILRLLLNRDRGMVHRVAFGGQ